MFQFDYFQFRIVFFEIENQSDSTAKLTGGFAENTTHLHLMAYPAKAGGAAVELPAIEVPAGVEFALEQGGVYLELDGVSFDLVEGEHFEITVFIEPFGALEVDVEIEAADAKQHSHAGHAH